MDAINLLLEATAERSALRGIVLATADGVALAGAGDIDADDLAMVGMQRSLSRPFQHVGLPLLLRGEALYTAAIDVEGVPLLLAAIGQSEPDAAQVFEAVERILV